MAERPAPRVIPSNAAENQRPNYERPEFKAGKFARKLCRAMKAGTSAVRAMGQDALPQWPAEEPKHYEIRAKIVRVIRYYARTVEAMVGMIVAKPVALAEDAAPILVKDAEDIDGQGTHFEVFARGVAEDAIHGGFSAILVDAPPVPETLQLTLEDEQALGLRPFWVAIPAERIPNWTVDAPDWLALLDAYGSGKLTADQVRRLARQVVVRMVVIFEPTDVQDGEFGTVTRNRYRVLNLTENGVWYRVWEERDSGDSVGKHFAMLHEGPMLGHHRSPLPAIPLAIVYASKPSAPFVAEPAALALAEANLDHYQVSADRRYLMRLTHSPTLFLAGFPVPKEGEEGRTKVGPNSVLRSPDSNAKAAYVAADPRALDSSQVEREELVRQMAAMGMSFIAKDRRSSVETATGRELDDAAEHSTHAVVGRGLQDGLEQAWVFHAFHRDVPPPSVEVNVQYASPALDPQVAGLLYKAVVDGRMDMDTWLHYLRTGKLPDDFNAAAYALEAAVNAEVDAAEAEAAAKEQEGTTDDEEQEPVDGEPVAA